MPAVGRWHVDCKRTLSNAHVTTNIYQFNTMRCSEAKLLKPFRCACEYSFMCLIYRMGAPNKSEILFEQYDVQIFFAMEMETHTLERTYILERARADE